MSDDKNVWKQFMDFQMRKNDGNPNNEVDNNNNGTRPGPSASCEMLSSQQQRENQNGLLTNSAGAMNSNSRERLKEVFSDDNYGRLFHGPDWERQSMGLLQHSYSTETSGIGRMTNGASSDVPSSSTSSSHVHLKSAQSSTENLIGTGSSGDCEPTYYFDGYESCVHDAQHHHQENGGGRSAGSSSHCCRQPLGTSFPHATMKLGVDSESDEDSLDLYLEYYRQSGGGAKDQQNPLNMSQASPRGQAQNSHLDEDIAVPSALQQQQQPGSSSAGSEGHGGLKMGILEMLEQLQALTRTRATAAAAATRQDGPSKSAFSTMHNAMPFQSPVAPHAGLGIYTTNENNLIVAQQYAEWEKEMELAEDSGFSMDFYFESGDMDGTLARSDMATSSRDLDSLALEGSRLNSEINQRRAASRFGLNSSLGQHRCDYSSLCPGAECTSADYNLIRVADNPRGFTPRSYLSAAAGDNVEPAPDQPNGSRKSSREVVETDDVEDNCKESLDAAEIPEECIYDVEERVAEDCELEPQTPVDSAEVLAGCDDMDGNCESSDCACLNPFEDLPLPTPLDTAVSPRPRQLGHGDSNNLVNTDKKLIAKVAGIKAGFKHFRRRISSCFVAQGE